MNDQRKGTSCLALSFLIKPILPTHLRIIVACVEVHRVYETHCPNKVEHVNCCLKSLFPAFFPVVEDIRSDER